MIKAILLVCTFLMANAETPAPSQEIQVVSLVSSSWPESNKIRLTFNVIKGHKIYKESIKIRPAFGEEIKLKDIQISPLHSFFDKYSKTSKQGVTEQFHITYDIFANHTISNDSYPLILEYQACSEEYCLFPQEFGFKIPMFIKNSSLSLERMMSESLLLALIFVFFAGFLTSFTPCIFPMIPLTIAILVPKGTPQTFSQKLSRSFLYVFGIALTYSVFGVIAASSGMMFGSLLGNKWVAISIGLFFVFFAVSMLGFFELKAPDFLTRTKLFKSSNTFLFGLAAGVVAGPCVGPVLLSILTFISKTGDIWMGFALMMSFAFGMGLIFIILGVAGDLMKLLPTSGSWMNYIKYLFSLIMIGLSFYYVRPVLSAAHFYVFACFVALIVACCFLFLYEKKFYMALPKASRYFFSALVAVSIATMGATIVFADQINNKSQTSLYENGWRAYSEEEMQKSIKSGKPTVIDFYAEWCMSCKELKHTTFKNSEVITKSSEFNLLMIDATHATAQIEKLKKQYNVIGLPTLLFFSSSGTLLPEATLTGFENGPDFLKRLDTVLQTK